MRITLNQTGGYERVLRLPVATNKRVLYDSEADVLYISFGEPRPAEGLDIGDGTILRVDPEADEVIELTIFDFSKIK